jgi:hypothetical protein
MADTGLRDYRRGRIWGFAIDEAKVNTLAPTCRN